MSNESTARTFAGSVDDARLQMTLEYLYTRLAEVERERDAAQAELVRMLPVVQAARALCDHGPAGILASLNAGQDPLANLAWAAERDSRWAALRRALQDLPDTYRAGTDG